MSFFRIAAVLGALALAACSPTFNWRTVPLDGAPLQALLPCKPEAGERRVPLAGVRTPLRLRHCETGGMRFVLAWADVQDPRRVPLALDGWPRVTLASLGVPAQRADDPALRWNATVAGASAVRAWQTDGVDPAGRPVRAQAVYFAQGTWVFQAAVFGERWEAAAADAFFDGLRLP